MFVVWFEVPINFEFIIFTFSILVEEKKFTIYDGEAASIEERKIWSISTLEIEFASKILPEKEELVVNFELYIFKFSIGELYVILYVIPLKIHVSIKQLFIEPVNDVINDVALEVE